MNQILVTTSFDIVDANDNETSLREALTIAQGTAGSDDITFAAGIDVVEIDSPLTIISGEDVTIDGAADDSGWDNVQLRSTSGSTMFDVQASGALRLEDLTFDNVDSNSSYYSAYNYAVYGASGVDGGTAGTPGGDGEDAASFVNNAGYLSLSRSLVRNFAVSAGDGGDGASGAEGSVPAGSDGGAGGDASTILNSGTAVISDSAFFNNYAYAGYGGQGGDAATATSSAGVADGGDGGDSGTAASILLNKGAGTATFDNVVGSGVGSTYSIYGGAGGSGGYYYGPVYSSYGVDGYYGSFGSNTTGVDGPLGYEPVVNNPAGAAVSLAYANITVDEGYVSYESYWWGGYSLSDGEIGYGTVEVDLASDGAVPGDFLLSWELRPSGTSSVDGNDLGPDGFASGQLQISQWETSAFIRFEYFNDANFEGDETFELVLTGATLTGGEPVLIGRSVTEITITDDDADTGNTQASGAPVITGTLATGETLTADVSSIVDPDSPGTMTFRWFTNGQEVFGNDTASLFVEDKWMGQEITVAVTFEDGAGLEETRFAAAPVTIALDPGYILVDTEHDIVADDGLTSLREAIAQAELTAGADTVVFGQNVQDLDLNASLTIAAGQEIIIDGDLSQNGEGDLELNLNAPILVEDGATVTVRDIDIGGYIYAADGSYHSYGSAADGVDGSSYDASAGTNGEDGTDGANGAAGYDGEAAALFINAGVLEFSETRFTGVSLEAGDGGTGQRGGGGGNGGYGDSFGGVYSGGDGGNGGDGGHGGKGGAAAPILNLDTGSLHLNDVAFNGVSVRAGDGGQGGHGGDRGFRLFDPTSTAVDGSYGNGGIGGDGGSAATGVLNYGSVSGTTVFGAGFGSGDVGYSSAGYGGEGGYDGGFFVQAANGADGAIQAGIFDVSGGTSNVLNVGDALVSFEETTATLFEGEVFSYYFGPSVTSIPLGASAEFEFEVNVEGLGYWSQDLIEVDWQLNPVGGSPADENDFSASTPFAGSFIIEEGNNYGELSIGIFNDATFEGDETFELVLTGARNLETGDALLVSSEALTVTIVDDDVDTGNTPASGKPVINGTVEVGQILTVDTSAIVDPDTAGSFEYAWYVGGEFVGFYGSAAVVEEAWMGQPISVEVTFVDQAGGFERLLSDPTTEVPVLAGFHLVTTSHDVVDPNDGETSFAEAIANAGVSPDQTVLFRNDIDRVDIDSRIVIAAGADLAIQGDRNIDGFADVELYFDPGEGMVVIDDGAAAVFNTFNFSTGWGSYGYYGSPGKASDGQDGTYVGYAADGTDGANGYDGYHGARGDDIGFFLNYGSLEINHSHFTSVYMYGQNGQDGQDGGDGGYGGDGGDGDTLYGITPGDGGAGGHGGTGGNGGDGGSVAPIINASDANVFLWDVIFDNVQVYIGRGGDGGNGGYGGYGGRGGHDFEGSHGADGADGANGADGTGGYGGFGATGVLNYGYLYASGIVGAGFSDGASETVPGTAGNYGVDGTLHHGLASIGLGSSYNTSNIVDIAVGWSESEVEMPEGGYDALYGHRYSYYGADDGPLAWIPLDLDVFGGDGGYTPIEIDWMIHPWGSNPTSQSDFGQGGALSGTTTMTYGGFLLQMFDDDLVEGNERFQVELTGARNAATGEDILILDSTIKVTILDDDTDGSNTQASGRPVIVGDIETGQQVQVSFDAISDLNGLGAFEITWYADGVEIPGANKQTLTIGTELANAKLSVGVAFVDGDGFNEYVVSTQTQEVIDTSGGTVFVTTSADIVDANDGMISLREALEIVRGSADDLDIRFAHHVERAHILEPLLIQTGDDISIIGNTGREGFGTGINGMDKAFHFAIEAGGTLSIQNVTLFGGYGAGNDGASFILDGDDGVAGSTPGAYGTNGLDGADGADGSTVVGSIFNYGTANLTDVVFVGNTIGGSDGRDGGDGGDGGRGADNSGYGNSGGDGGDGGNGGDGGDGGIGALIANAPGASMTLTNTVFGWANMIGAEGGDGGWGGDGGHGGYGYYDGYLGYGGDGGNGGAGGLLVHGVLNFGDLTLNGAVENAQAVSNYNSYSYSYTAGYGGAPGYDGAGRTHGGLGGVYGVDGPGGSVAVSGVQTLGDGTVSGQFVDGLIDLAASELVIKEGTGQSSTFTFDISARSSGFYGLNVYWEVVSVAATAADFDGGILPSGMVSLDEYFSTETIEIEIEIEGDSLVELDEEFIIRISDWQAHSGFEGIVFAYATSELSVVIEDDDNPDVQDGAETTLKIFDAAATAEGDTGDANTLSFVVKRGGDIDTEVTVDSNVTIGNVTVAGPSVTFLPYELEKTITVPITGDDIEEPNAQVRVDLVNPVMTQPGTITFLDSRALGTILDDDAPIAPPPPPSDGPRARAWGDPHLVSLDGLGYSFQAVGEFVLIEATSGDDLMVQIRTIPISDLVSVISSVATVMDGQAVEIDGNDGVPQVTIDGTVVSVTEGGVHTLSGGAGEIYLSNGVYTVVYSNGEQLTVSVTDEGALSVQAYLDDTRATGSLQGLLGDADGDTANDLALRNGTVLTQPVSFTDLYGQYADSWRISEGEAHFARDGFETTADHQDTSYPKGQLTVSDLPTSILAAATAAVDAAGITDPHQRDAAILDYALTGQFGFVEAAATGEEGASSVATPTGAPAPSPTLVATAVDSVAEGDEGDTYELIFTVGRMGDTSGALEVDYDITGTIPVGLISGSTVGTLSFLDGESEKTASITINGNDVYFGDVDINFEIDAEPANVLFANTGVITTVEEDDPQNFDATGPVTISGTARVGEELTAVTSSIDDANGVGTLRYRWYADGVLIAGAAAASFTLTSAQVGKAISVEVYFTDNDGFDESLDSAATSAVVEAVTPTPTTPTPTEPTPTEPEPEGPTEGDDVLVGDGDANEIDALGGDDVVRGLGGDDKLFGRGGDDRLVGGGGDDIVKGNAGADRLVGNAGNDKLVGGGGSDNLRGGGGKDILLGLGGNDKLNGGPGADVLKGGGGKDTLLGRGGNDVLKGGTKNDVLKGGAGKDKLYGDAGNDQMEGNGGKDQFIFNKPKAGEKDTILDFTDGIDLLKFKAGTTVTASSVANGVLVDADGHKVLLKGFDIADWGTDDFGFL